MRQGFVTLMVDDKKVATGRVPRAIPFENLLVNLGFGLAVGKHYKNRFTSPAGICLDVRAEWCSGVLISSRIDSPKTTHAAHRRRHLVDVRPRTCKRRRAIERDCITRSVRAEPRFHIDSACLLHIPAGRQGRPLTQSRDFGRKQVASWHICDIHGLRFDFRITPQLPSLSPVWAI